MATRTLEDALNIIELLRKKYSLGVSELSKELKLNKNKVFRIITTLELKGIVELNPETGKYKLGMNLIKLEDAYIKNQDFIKVARPVIRSLRKEINETIYMAIQHKKDVIYIYEEPARKGVVVNSRLAQRFKAHKTAAGKVLRKAKKEIGFPMEKIILPEEEIIEIASIVRDEFYNPIAAISVIAPIHRVNNEKEKIIEEKLISSAEEITELLAPAFSLD